LLASALLAITRLESVTTIELDVKAVEHLNSENIRNLSENGSFKRVTTSKAATSGGKKPYWTFGCFSWMAF